jgi:SAM-dependent methyltransferase
MRAPHTDEHRAASEESLMDGHPTLSYGRGVPDENELRLCGDVTGRRVIELGSTAAANAITLARRGAKTMVIDPSSERLAEVRSLADQSDVSIECHRGDLADLGFATSASVDLVLCVGGLASVDDISRVFRQVHRVLRTDAPFVLAVPHPFAAMIDVGDVVRRRYWGDDAIHTVGGLFTALQRANFQVDVMLEPEPVGNRDALAPTTLIVRARKLGV